VIEGSFLEEMRLAIEEAVTCRDVQIVPPPNRFGAYETPAFILDELVRVKASGRTGKVKGFYGWNPPILLYLVYFADDESLSEYLSESDIGRV